MNKIQQSIKTLNEAQELIDSLRFELDKSRAINYRYYLKHGEDIFSEPLENFDHLYFAINAEDKTDVKCNMIDHNKLKMASPYNKICEKINNLKKD